MFDILGYELVIQEEQGVIGLNNPAGTGRIHLKKIESVIILILRLLYIEERKKLSQTNDVIVAVDQLIDKYNMLKIQKAVNMATRGNLAAVELLEKQLHNSGSIWVYVFTIGYIFSFLDSFFLRIKMQKKLNEEGNNDAA